MICPTCGHPCPANEFAAYGRHEDCALPRLMTPSQITGAAIRSVLGRKFHELGGDYGLPADRHRAGRDPALSKVY